VAFVAVPPGARISDSAGVVVVVVVAVVGHVGQGHDAGLVAGGAVETHVEVAVAHGGDLQQREERKGRRGAGE